jgi:hypothetical protein
MTDARFEELMRDAAQTYRRPPEAPLDAMWKEIEAAQLGAGIASSTGLSPKPKPGRRRFDVSRWMAIAATLVIGIGLGRWSTALVRSPAPTTTRIAAVSVKDSAAAAVKRDTGLAVPYDVETSRYLGQTAALLIALPSEVRAGRADEQFVNRAGDLLTRTRLLLDSPAASEPQMRALLEDLELVLAQVVQLQNNHSKIDLDLINQALEQRDVILRLRTAVADISAN